MPLQERKVLEDLAQRLDALNAKEQGLHSVIEHRNLQAFNSGSVTAGALNQRLRLLRKQELDASERNTHLLQRLDEIKDAVTTPVLRGGQLEHRRNAFREKAKELVPAWCKQFELETRQQVTLKEEQLARAARYEEEAAHALKAGEQNAEQLRSLDARARQLAMELSVKAERSYAFAPSSFQGSYEPVYMQKPQAFMQAPIVDPRLVGSPGREPGPLAAPHPVGYVLAPAAPWPGVFAQPLGASNFVPSQPPAPSYPAEHPAQLAATQPYPQYPQPTALQPAAVQSDAQPAAQLVAYPAARPAFQPGVRPDVQPVAEPGVVQPVAQPVLQPGVQPGVQAVVPPGVQPIVGVSVAAAVQPVQPDPQTAVQGAAASAPTSVQSPHRESPREAQVQRPTKADAQLGVADVCWTLRVCFAVLQQVPDVEFDGALAAALKSMLAELNSTPFFRSSLVKLLDAKVDQDEGRDPRPALDFLESCSTLHVYLLALGALRTFGGCPGSADDLGAPDSMSRVVFGIVKEHVGAMHGRCEALLPLFVEEVFPKATRSALQRARDILAVVQAEQRPAPLYGSAFDSPALDPSAGPASSRPSSSSAGAGGRARASPAGGFREERGARETPASPSVTPAGSYRSTRSTPKGAGNDAGDGLSAYQRKKLEAQGGSKTTLLARSGSGTVTMGAKRPGAQKPTLSYANLGLGAMQGLRATLAEEDELDDQSL